MNALNPSHASLIAEVTALRASLSDAVELVESLRTERDALRTALLRLLNAAEGLDSLYDDESRAEAYASELEELSQSKDTARITLRT